TGDLFGIFRSPFQTSTLTTLLEIDGMTVQSGQTLLNATGFPGGTNVPPSAVSTPTPVNFGGPLLTASDSVINTHGNFLNFTFGADVGHGVGNAFVDLLRTNITTTAGAGAGHFLELCCGTPAATLTFRGSLLASNNSHVILAGSLANITDGAT